MALTLFAATFATLEINAYTRTSATWDEPIHVTLGFAALSRGDYRIDPEHPPFLRMWAAMPLLAMGDVALNVATVDRTPPNDWAWIVYPVCQQFLYRDNGGDRLLYRARFMIVLLGVGLGVLLFCWALEWLGFWPAVLGLAFYTVEPNLFAHASLVTTDMGAACFMFGTIYFLWRTWRKVTVWNVVGLTAFFVLALVSKFSSILLAPIVLVLLAIAVRTAGDLRARTGVSLVVLLAFAGWLGIWAAYGFRYAPSASGTWLYHLQHDAQVQAEVPGLARVVSWIDDHRLLPNAYSQGFLFSQAKSQVRRAFFAGEFSERGWWYYFPVAFLIKTPIATLALVIAGFLFAAGRRRELGSVNLAFVMLPVVIYLGAAMTARINIGLRHILPVYPLVLLLAMVPVGAWLSAKGRGRRLVVVGALALAVLEFGSVYPHALAFFNQLVGGPARGADYLVDSNLDWGQDLKPLKRWMDANGVSHINLAYFGTADPAYYGINATHLPGSQLFVEASAAYPQIPGYVAASKTLLSGVYLSPRERSFYAKLRLEKPVADIGHTILVYRVDRPWW